MTDQRDRQAVVTGTPGPTDTVHVFVAAARHIEVDHHVQAVHVQAASGDVGGHEDLHPALLQAVDGQLAVLLVLLAVQDESLVFLGDQAAVDTVGHGPGVGEDNGFLIGLVGQQPVEDLLFMLVVVSGDDLLARGVVQLADRIELQVLRVVQDLGDHIAQAGTTGGGGEQHGLLAVGAFVHQALYVFGKAHVEHAVGFVEYQHFDFFQVQVAGVQLLDHPPRGADQDIRHLAQHGGLDLEVFTTGDQAGLDESELGETLDFLDGLLGQLAGWQQDQGLDADANLGRTDQAIEDRQDERGGLAAAGLRRHPQVTPLQRQRNGRGLHRRRLDKFKLGHGFEQAFVQGEFGKHGCYLEEIQNISGIG